MEKNIKLIKRVLEALEKSVDWKEEKPKLEGTFGKVSDGGDHEMKNAKANYASVKDGGAKKVETKPAFSSVKDPGTNGGGAKTNAKPGTVKDPFKVDTKSEMKEGAKVIAAAKPNDPDAGKSFYTDKSGKKIAIDPKTGKPPVQEASTNMKKVTDKNPAINEEEQVLDEMSVNRRKLTGRPKAIGEAEEFEKTLGEAKCAQAKRLREAIEAISGKKVVYADKK